MLAADREFMAAARKGEYAVGTSPGAYEFEGAAISGARGVPDTAIVEAIRRGVTKVNIDTDMRIAFAAYVRNAPAEKPEEIDPRKVLGPGREAVAAVVREKMKLFGSVSKAG